MPRFGVIGDVHGHMERLELVLEALAEATPDAILMVGDLGAEPALAATSRMVLRRVAQLDRPVLFVPGNHDPAQIDDLPGARNVDHRVLELAGLQVWGIGGAGPNRFGFPYEWTEAQLRARPRHHADILLAHCPPQGCQLDATAFGTHAGSAAIGELLAAGLVRLMLCGHIHESPGCQRINGIPCVNAGALGSPFGAPQFVLLDYGADSIAVQHKVLPYERRPETAAWCRGKTASPAPGQRSWSY